MEQPPCRNRAPRWPASIKVVLTLAAAAACSRAPAQRNEPAAVVGPAQILPTVAQAKEIPVPTPTPTPAVSAPANDIGEASSAVVFPTVLAKTLANRDIEFPKQIRGQVGLLFVAFEQNAQAQINSWLTPLIGAYLDSTQVAYYEIPMISGAYKAAAEFIDGGMRRGVPKNLHDRTATYYGPREAFCDALKITDRSKAYLFVLDREGRVVFRAAGMATDQASQAANASIVALLKQPQ